MVGYSLKGCAVSLLLEDALHDQTLLEIATQGLTIRVTHAHNSAFHGSLRLNRAAEHLANLESRIERYITRQQDAVSVQVDAAGRLGLRNQLEDPERIWSIYIGEVIYNLRAALDYLVYGLAWLGSGVHQTFTQFPIEDDPKVWDRRRETYLKGVRDVHVAAIRKLQPFDGCDWTASLRDVSNQDKHWALKLTAVQHAGTITFDPPIGQTNVGALAAGEVDVQHDPTFNVTLEDGTPVLEWLQGLHAEVGRVLTAFKPAFDWSRPVKVGPRYFKLAAPGQPLPDQLDPADMRAASIKNEPA